MILKFRQKIWKQILKIFEKILEFWKKFFTENLMNFFVNPTRKLVLISRLVLKLIPI